MCLNFIVQKAWAYFGVKKWQLCGPMWRWFFFYAKHNYITKLRTVYAKVYKAFFVDIYRVVGRLLGRYGRACV